MTNNTDADRLKQGKLIASLTRDMPITEMVTVYLSENKNQHNRGTYCALIPSAKIEESLNRTSWDLMHGGGMPGAVMHGGRESSTIEYCRFGDTKGIEPLVIDREFHEIHKSYKEISEEFRLFHELYHDRKLDHFIKIDDDGIEQLVATIEPELVMIRLLEIRQFLAIKEMHLAIMFDCREYSSSLLEQLELHEGGGDHRRGLACWSLHYGDNDMGGHRAFSRLLGKRLIPPLPKEKSGFWGYAEEKPKKCAEFIIGVTAQGDEITSTQGGDEYLTPVHFRKTVLDKYYQNPGKYSVDDAYLQCGALWGMYIDNHHDDKVCAWIGDLWRDLSYHEQLHWRSHNIAPTGGMSKTFIRRQIDAEFTDSDRPEHVFKELYKDLQKVCGKVLGWQLLLQLSSEDQHYFQCIRIPATDEQRDFDNLVGSLSKILIDSLNEKALNGLIPAEERKNLKGSISRLEATFAARGICRGDEHIKFLRNLQDLRSSGSAHRKGSNYRKIAAEFGVNSQNLRDVFSGMLHKGVEFLEYLTSTVRSGHFGGT